MTELAAAVRSLHIVSLTLLTGGLTFVLLVGRPALRRAGQEASDFRRRLERFQLSLSRWSLLGVFLTSILGLWLQTGATSDRSPTQVTPADLSNVLTGTQYGKVWLIRLLLLTILAGLLLVRRTQATNKQWRELGWGDFFLACAILGALAFSGHAASGEGNILFIQIAADVLHLIGAAVWLGGLVPLAVFLHWADGMDSAFARAVAREATRRFSLLGIASVSLLILTGFMNALFLVGGFAALVGTPYGNLLLAKLGIMLPLIALAASNLLRLKPKLLIAACHPSFHEFSGVLLRLRRNAVIEAGLGTVIIIVVGWMSFTPPARHIQPSWPFSFRWSWVAVEDSSRVQSEVFFGTALAAFGVLSLVAAAMVQRERSWTGGVGLACIAYGSAVALPALSVDAYPTTYMRPSVAYHAISIANGLRLYEENCALCHGAAGFGDGPVAEGLKPSPADLTAKHTGNHTAGDLFWWLSHGIRNTAMPGYGMALTPEERWDLINFMRALSAAEQARPMVTLVEPTPSVVAPDFSYRASNGEEKTLKDHRGDSVVLLVLFTYPGSSDRLAQIDNIDPKLKSLGVQVLAIPDDESAPVAAAGTATGHLPIVVDGGREAFEVYALFRRSFSAEGSLPNPPAPPHMEFLVDRQGYLRARWIPDDRAGWSNIETLLREIERLVKENARAPAPDEHVH